MAKSFIGAALLAPALALAAPASANVGIASAVTGEPVGRPVANAERVLRIGNDMTANEVVTTHANDRLQIVFLDGSTLTVGPQSEVTIDRFVYDPERKNGQLAFRVGRGMFRYVGGAISKSSEVTVRTQSATMGIRGGIAVFSVTSSGAMSAAMLFGSSLSITSGGVTMTTTQPGTQISAAANAAPAAPATLQPGSLQQFDRAFQNTTQGTAGSAIGSAIGSAMAGSSLGQANSSLAPSAARAAIPAAQQAQLTTARAAAAPAAGQGPMQGAGPLQGAGPMQASGPLQGAPVTQATGPGAGALQTAGGLQSAGPLSASSPFQAAGPLQNAGPLAAAGPNQQTGPIQGPVALNLAGIAPAQALPNAATPAALGAALAQGTPGALGQLQSLLGSDRGRDGGTLSTLVTAMRGGSDGGGSRGEGGGRNEGGGRGEGGSGSPPSVVPVVLPPQVYENPSNRKVSPD